MRGARWHKSEDSVLEENYPKFGAHECAKHLPGRTIDAIRRRAISKRLLHVQPTAAWSETEIGILRAHYPTGGAEACMDKLTDRTVTAIYQQASRLRLARVQPE